MSTVCNLPIAGASGGVFVEVLGMPAIQRTSWAIQVFGRDNSNSIVDHCDWSGTAGGAPDSPCTLANETISDVEWDFDASPFQNTDPNSWNAGTITVQMGRDVI